MEITHRSDDFFIEGNIKTIGDFQEIKHALDGFIKHNTSVKLTIKDSISVTSSVIGYLTKLVLKDKIDVSVYVGNSELINLFEDLGLRELLHVRSIA